MRLKEFTIKKFRSIEEITIKFPENKPVILFGPNNVGKSNILKALECFLGERFASYYDFKDSDYYLRDKEKYPNIFFEASFDEDIYHGNSYHNQPTKTICFSTNEKNEGKKENFFHYPKTARFKKIYLSNEDREKCQIIMVDATRDITRQLSYFSQYSLLSKMSNKMHAAMKQKVKDKLDKCFENIKNVFDSVPEYKNFYEKLHKAFASNIDGFEHKLEIDLSAYDPNNYFHSLKIIAKDGQNVRSFNEFGTGEQQILLMSFVKAYAETFKGENFILGIEEPEAHLHPLAQRWLSKNIDAISKSGIQVIITTHSPEFLNIENVEGFVKVYKQEDVTKIEQHTAESLSVACNKTGATKAKENNVLEFYKTKTFYDQLRGFFAQKILLVEGETEFFALPNYFKNCGVDLIKNGVEIINCRGKNQILRNFRLFNAYGYECFCLFDGDANTNKNINFAEIFQFKETQMNFDEKEFTFNIQKKYGYFGKNFETYMRKNFATYSNMENDIGENKIINAKILSEQNLHFKPTFIENISQSLNLFSDEDVSCSEMNDIETEYDEVPF
ncbi:MAG: AAA family ATPase [Elusimicrobia bacterium]|nr:AAA family ATPase [Elusimicrobiota bacterium]